MILLTGAHKAVGTALLRRLTSTGSSVRCLVQDPRELGAERVRVQIALGDLTEPSTFRNALKGVDTVVHLADATRDSPTRSVEELNGVVTWRLVRAAENAGVKRFIFLSSLGASELSESRVLRSKALAESAVMNADIENVVLAPSLMYQPGEGWLGALERYSSLLPFVPIPFSRRARVQPVWAHDVADCFAAVIDGAGAGQSRFEIAGPETMSYREMVRTSLASLGKHRPAIRVPFAVAGRMVAPIDFIDAASSAVVKDEIEMMHEAMLATGGTHDARELGVEPSSLSTILAADQR